MNLGAQYNRRSLRVPSLLHRTIGENVRSLRRAQRPRMSQERLAALSGLHRNTVAQLESGTADTVKLETLEAIAPHLRVEVHSLLLPAEPVLATDVQRRIDEFMNSEIAGKVEPDEEAHLRGAAWLWGPPPIKAVFHALEAYRAQKSFVDHQK